MKVVDGDFLAENRSCAESVLLSLLLKSLRLNDTAIAAAAISTGNLYLIF